VSGAISPDEVKKIFSELGFKHINITAKGKSKDIIKDWNIGKAADVVFSAYIQAVKPDNCIPLHLG
jgi:hypothetical protein